MQFSLMDELQEHEFTLLPVDAPLNVVQTCICSYVGSTTGVWLIIHLNTFSFRLFSTHFLITLHICLNIPHPMVTYLS
jgi:hypothetical protein